MAMSIFVIISSCLLSLSSILAQVFLPLAVYNDAKAHYNKNTVLFTVLIIFFPFIAGIVYLVTRNKPDQVDYTKLGKNCLTCGAPCNGAEYMCHNCGGSSFTELYGPEDVPARQKKAKGFLIGAIVCWALTIILTIAVTALSVILFMQGYEIY